MVKRIGLFLSVLFFSIWIVSCASIPKPEEIEAPTPIEGNTGKFMCPYTSDGTVTKWVEKGTVAKLGSSVGSYAGRKAMENVPFVGGWLGEKAGREIAIQLVGGWDFIKENSDLSFDKMNDMTVFLYVTYSKNEHWTKVSELYGDIYPDFKNNYASALRNAKRKK